ncbi:MAG: peptidyl-prolyl cis-trans isomerase [Streptococcaceae bacterium]|nr:peptidyl-prolyl cis-trans isomerase [Streptococcaceae bacterium]
MKLVKKLALAALTLVGVIGLAGCVQGGVNKSIITMKGNTVTIEDFYAQAKTFPSAPATTLLQNLTFSKIFEKEFGTQVTQKDVDAKIATARAAYSNASAFTSALGQQGYTEASYKELVRLQLLQQKAIDKEVKATQFTTANLKAAWATYHPEVDTYVVGNSSQSAAQQAHDLAKSNLDQFKTQAKDNKLEMKFDSASTKLPSDVMTAAFKLKDGAVSDVITVQNADGSSTYYVVYMIKNPGKGTDMNKYKTQLENYIMTQKEQDSTFVQGVIKQYLTKYNVTVKENSFSNIFSNFSGVQ